MGVSRPRKTTHNASPSANHAAIPSRMANIRGLKENTCLKDSVEVSMKGRQRPGSGSLSSVTLPQDVFMRRMKDPKPASTTSATAHP